MRVLLATNTHVYYAYAGRVASLELAAQDSANDIINEIELSHPCTHAIELSDTQLLCRLEYAGAPGGVSHGMWTVLQLDQTTRRLIGERKSLSLPRALSFSNRQNALVKTASRVVGLDQQQAAAALAWSVALNVDLSATDVDQYYTLVEGALAWYTSETLVDATWYNGVVPRASQLDVSVPSGAVALDPRQGIVASGSGAPMAFPAGINGERTVVLVGRGAFVDAATNTRLAVDGVRLHGYEMTPATPVTTLSTTRQQTSSAFTQTLVEPL